MKAMINIVLALLLIFPAVSCDEVKEYPWNDAWNETETPQDQETPEDTESPEEPEAPEQPETPADPEVPQDPETPGEPETPEDPSEPETPEDPETPVDPETPIEPEVPVGPSEWTDVTSEFGTLPSYIKIYTSSLVRGKKAVSYIAEADMSQAEWDVWSVKAGDDYKTSDSFRTPSEVYNEKGASVVINGGYFFYEKGNYTSSLAVSNSEVLAYNINYASEDWVTVYYPTRAAFLELADGTHDACWTYKSWAGHWMYPSPAENSWESKPKQQPNAEYPAGAVTFSAKTGIGGGPVLIDGGKLANTYEQELFQAYSDVHTCTNQPRTAVGVTADNKMIFFVCEGREMTTGVHGLTTADVADALLELGCVEAINLDGGGSSCMLVNGKETIKVCDGSQRAVASTVMLR